MFEVTMQEMVDCINRELAFRSRVYPRWVRDGKMSQKAADMEMIRMQAVRDKLVSLQRQEKAAV